MQDYCKSNRLISLKFSVMIGPTDLKSDELLVAIRSLIQIPEHFSTFLTNVVEQGISGYLGPTAPTVLNFK